MTIPPCDGSKKFIPYYLGHPLTKIQPAFPLRNHKKYGHVTTGWFVLLLIASFVFCFFACRRLNPEWCTQKSTCPSGTICDPQTNTCQPMDAGSSNQLDHSSRQDFHIHQDAREENKDASNANDAKGLFDSALPIDGKNLCSSPSDEWTCSGGAAGLCKKTFTKQRDCPQSRCNMGHCLMPDSPKTCITNADCTNNWVCTLLLDNNGIPQNICAAPIVGTPPPASCTTLFSCSTGLCTDSGQCYFACENEFSCPLIFKCNLVEINVEGVKINKKSCSP